MKQINRIVQILPISSFLYLPVSPCSKEKYSNFCTFVMVTNEVLTNKVYAIEPGKGIPWAVSVPGIVH